ncbi:MAG: ABC transporter permease [Betaproteobacteria bacterium RIFCSPLOWO2_12_FULL_65_14]|nr:MAG: ABC transporter permease [Betaproteobacteria bacterium RIFCSPLOWO2_12_FULL_65_14]
MSASRPRPPRDPDALKRATALLAAALLLWPLLIVAEFRPGVLLDPANLRLMRDFLAAFFPPALQPDFVALLARATVETLAIATAGTAIAMLIAMPLAFVVTDALSVSRIGPGPGRAAGRALRGAMRAIMAALRSVPEVVWALLLVRAFGLGPAAGVLAIGVTYGGMLAKVYAEILESGDTRPARSLLEAGSGRVAAFFYGLLPGAAQELASYTVYRWECGLRAAVVMGLVGAGGLGQLLDQSIKMLNGGEVATTLAVFLVLVLAADALSAALRRLLA